MPPVQLGVLLERRLTDGCEIDTQTDPSHCGGCNLACPAGATCQGGTSFCSGGLELCNGACVDTTTNPSHCGGCYRFCDSSTETCVIDKCLFNNWVPCVYGFQCASGYCSPSSGLCMPQP